MDQIENTLEETKTVDHKFSTIRGLPLGDGKEWVSRLQCLRKVRKWIQNSILVFFVNLSTTIELLPQNELYLPQKMCSRFRIHLSVTTSSTIQLRIAYKNNHYLRTTSVSSQTEIIHTIPHCLVRLPFGSVSSLSTSVYRSNIQFIRWRWKIFPGMHVQVKLLWYFCSPPLQKKCNCGRCVCSVSPNNVHSSLPHALCSFGLQLYCCQCLWTPPTSEIIERREIISSLENCDNEYI